MKAKAFRLDGNDYLPCEPAEATHLQIDRPGPGRGAMLPVMIGGRREGTTNWTWNGDVEKPTLKPSILTRGTVSLTDEDLEHVGKGFEPARFVCHSFVNDGKVKFLGDCTHEFANQTLDLLDVE